MSEVAQCTMDEAIEIAAKEGLWCEFPQPDELFIDIDNAAGYINADVVAAINKTESYPLKLNSNILYTTSKSGNRHAYIKCSNPVGDMQRVALQAALGSDPVKEALSVLRLNLESTAANVLFETPKGHRELVIWREGAFLWGGD